MIDVDPIALSYVLQVIGSVQVPPYPQVVSATNSLLELNYIINFARPGDPGKVYLAPFGHAVVAAASQDAQEPVGGAGYGTGARRRREAHRAQLQ